MIIKRFSQSENEEKTDEEEYLVPTQWIDDGIDTSLSGIVAAGEWAEKTPVIDKASKRWRKRIIQGYIKPIQQLRSHKKKERKD